MPLGEYFSKIILLASIVFFTSCNADENMHLEGWLVYSNGGSSINAITLGGSEYNFSSIYRGKEIGAINHLTSATSDIILFGECAITGECVIKQCSVEVGQTRLLRSGRLPSYISNHDKLFFYDRASDGDNWLFITSLKDVNAITKVAKEPKWKSLPNGISQPVTTAVIQISSDEIIFVGEDEQLWLYNIANTKLTSTDVKSCRPVLWRDKSNQLLCSDWKTWDPFLLDIKTKGKVRMPEFKGAYGFVYVPNSDALIYGRTRSSFLLGEAYDIFLYSFTDKKEERIKENSHIAGGVWRK